MEIVGLRLDILIPGVIILFLLAVAGIFLALSLRAYQHEKAESRSYYSASWTDSGWAIATIFVGTIAVVGLFMMLFVLFPYQPKYWQVYSITGHVTNVTNQFSSGNGDLTVGDYAVTFDTLGTQVAVDDPRIVTMQGADVRVICTEEWVPYGTGRFNCTNPVVMR